MMFNSTIDSVLFLISFPLAIACLAILVPVSKIRAYLVRFGALVISAFSVYLAYQFFNKNTEYFTIESHLVERAVFFCEIGVALYLLYRCKNILRSEFWIPLIIVINLGLGIYLEYCGVNPVIKQGSLYVDQLSVIMALIIGIIGSLICVFAVGYMKEYHEHHHEIKDRSGTFFFILFIFLSSMFGVVFSNNLVWLFLCWEITTLCSFELIGYSRTEEAVRNAYRALGLNALGGLGFILGIIYLVKFSETPTIEISGMLAGKQALVLIPALLISFAGLAKSAQMPFSSWLLGAMVAPTPVSALLHSSTMVKAGVFIIIKFATIFHGTWAGYVLACIGGVTFLITSILAVTQSNAKRVLAYSTIANLGLIIMCSGIGSETAVWAAVMLLIFHAVAKALLFLSVGTFEHKSGSRDIEDMEGLIVLKPWLGMAMVIGMMGMFLAPFGMLISKWASIKAMINLGSFPPLPAILLAFGSGPTLFFWVKWIGKIISVPVRDSDNLHGKISGDEKISLSLLSILTVLASGIFPLIAAVWVLPYIKELFGSALSMSREDVFIMLVMFCCFILFLPLVFIFVRQKNFKKVHTYLAGTNINWNAAYLGGLGLEKEVSIRNYYLKDFFKEDKIFKYTAVFAIVLIIVMFISSVGAI